MNFSLTILGSSSAVPTSRRFPTAHLLNVNERFFLIDCGEGTQIQFRNFRLGFGKLNQIFISHMHGDHVFGLFGLLSTLQLLGRKNELQIFGPAALGNYLEYFRKNFSLQDGYVIRFTAVGTRGFKMIFEDEWVEVFSIPLKHRTETTGFLFREKPAELNFRKDAMDIYKPSVEDIQKIKKGKDLVLFNGQIIPNKELTLPPWKRRSYAYCSDTAFSPGIAGYIKGVDLLYHEATFEDKDADLAGQTLHSTASQAAQIAKKAGAGKLLIGHFSNRYKSTEILEKQARAIFENSFAVEDGDIYMIERERETFKKEPFE